MSSVRKRSPAVRPRNAPSARPGPAGGTRDANRKARTQAIAKAALELFLDRGVEGVSVDDVVRRARIAKGSFYTYFRDLSEVVEALIEPVGDAVRASLDACDTAIREARDYDSLLGAYQTLGLALSTAVLANPDVTRLYLQERRAPDHGPRSPLARLAAEIDHRAVTLTEAAHLHGLLKAFDPRVTAATVVGAVEHLLHRALSGHDLGPMDAIPEILLRLVVDGIGVGPTGPLRSR